MNTRERTPFPALEAEQPVVLWEKHSHVPLPQLARAIEDLLAVKTTIVAPETEHCGVELATVDFILRASTRIAPDGFGLAVTCRQRRPDAGFADCHIADVGQVVAKGGDIPGLYFLSHTEHGAKASGLYVSKYGWSVYT